MSKLEQNLEYLIVSFFALNVIFNIPSFYSFLACRFDNAFIVYGGTAGITLLAVAITVFCTKYIFIPVNIAIGKFLYKII